MKCRRYRALVSLKEAAPGHDVASPTCSLVLRAHAHTPERAHALRAMITTDDGEPLHPGDRQRLVTISVTDDHAPEFLRSGERFELWRGHDVGSGTISHQVLP